MNKPSFVKLLQFVKLNIGGYVALCCILFKWFVNKRILPAQDICSSKSIATIVVKIFVVSTTYCTYFCVLSGFCWFFWKKRRAYLQATDRAFKKFFSSRLIMNSRWLWNSHQRRTFLRAEASRDILKFRVSEIASPGVFNRYFPPRTPCCFVGIHARLEAMPSKCPRRSTTSHGSNVSQIWSCLNMRSMSFKTGKRMLHNFIRWCLFFLAVMTHLW